MSQSQPMIIMHESLKYSILESEILLLDHDDILPTPHVVLCRWDEARAGRDLHVIDGLTVTKMANDGGDYATVLGTLCLSSGEPRTRILN